MKLKEAPTVLDGFMFLGVQFTLKHIDIHNNISVVTKPKLSQMKEISIMYHETSFFEVV